MTATPTENLRVSTCYDVLVCLDDVGADCANDTRRSRILVLFQFIAWIFQHSGALIVCVKLKVLASRVFSQEDASTTLLKERVGFMSIQQQGSLGQRMNGRQRLLAQAAKANTTRTAPT
jgi:hypothetical protein